MVTDQDSEGVVGVYGEVSAASMAGRNVLNPIGVTDRLEGALRAGAAGGALG